MRKASYVGGLPRSMRRPKVSAVAMPNVMKSISVLLAFLAMFPGGAFSQEEEEPLPKFLAESFKKHLREYSHALLVCTYKDYRVLENGNDGLYERYYEESTIVRVFKGDAEVSQKIKFYRMIEGRPNLRKRANGELSFVFFDEISGGELLLGTGDGFQFHKDLLAMAVAFRSESEQVENSDAGDGSKKR